MTDPNQYYYYYTFTASISDRGSFVFQGERLAATNACYVALCGSVSVLVCTLYEILSFQAYILLLCLGFNHSKCKSMIVEYFEAAFNVIAIIIKFFF